LRRKVEGKKGLAESQETSRTVRLRNISHSA
jgi:hypothetical protein